MSDYINIDMQIEIMRRVPVKSLLQFRSVSKEWKFVIDSSYFAKAYNICQTRPHRSFVSYRTPRINKCACAILTTNPDHDHANFPSQKFFHHLPKCVETSIAESLTVGCDHGLVCFSGLYFHARQNWKKMYLLWNPALGKFVAIDLPTSRSDNYAVVGFGVSPSTTDPKLVRIEDFSRVAAASDNYIATYVQVFTLSSGVWRSPYKNVPRKSINILSSNIALDGFIYWLADERVNRNNSECYNLIISFNLSTELFEEVKLPDSLAHQGRTTLSISKLRGSLVVLQQTDKDEKIVNDVWMMEPGVPKSFKKVFTINEPFGSSIDYGFSKDDETVMETAGLEAYQVFSRHRKDLGISGIRGSFSVTPYIESLLLRDEPTSKDITADL